MIPRITSPLSRIHSGLLDAGRANLKPTVSGFSCAVDNRMFSGAMFSSRPPITEHLQYVGSHGSVADYPETTASRLVSHVKAALPSIVQAPLDFIELALKRPDDVSEIAHDDPIRHEGEGIRVDTRSPAVMLEQYPEGFVSRSAGASLSINNQVKVGGGPKTGLVAFATQDEGTDVVVDQRMRKDGAAQVFKYNFRASAANCFSLDRTLSWKQRVTPEAEALTPGTSLSQVVSVTTVNGKTEQTTHFPFTPIVKAMDELVEPSRLRSPNRLASYG